MHWRLTLTLLCIVSLARSSIAGDGTEEDADPAPNRTVAHRVMLTHPGYNEAKPMPCSLVQVHDARGYIQEYYLDVNSVTCGDGVCDIVMVRLYWDALGHYHCYRLPEGAALTKQGHEVFSAADHAKLHALLSDPYLSLKQVSIDQVIAPDKAMEDVDGITGATPLAHLDSVVPGAVYTTFTLWHWANGAAGKTIRTLTEQGCSREQLVHYLNHGTEAFFIWAAEQLTRRKISSPAILDITTRRLKQGSTTLVDPALLYLQSLSTDSHADPYHRTIESLFGSASEPKRIKYMESLAAARQPPPAGYHDRLSRHLATLDTYYEVHLLLCLMESQERSSPEVVRQTLPLLDGNEFFIARRAFRFLQNQDLTEPQQRKVEAFRLAHQDRL